jgi:chromate transport protein ChrA
VEGFEFALYGVPAVLIVMGIMELLKAIWLDVNGEPVIKDRWAVVAAVVVGLVVSFCAKLAALFPGFAEWLWVVVTGIFTGLSAGGVYSLVKRRTPPTE